MKQARHLIRNGREERASTVRRGAVIACLVALSAISACGSSNDVDSSARSATTSASTPGSNRLGPDGASNAPVDDVGGGDVASGAQPLSTNTPSEGMLGSRGNPLGTELVSSNTGYDTMGVLRAQPKNVCRDPGIEQAGHSFTRFGVSGTYSYVYLSENTRLYLVCSTPQPAIWPLTTGPGSQGVSVPCPEGTTGVLNWSGSVSFEDNLTGATIGNVTQSDGGYGRNGDGLWNYKFHNWNTVDVRATIWAVCGVS